MDPVTIIIIGIVIICFCFCLFGAPGLYYYYFYTSPPPEAAITPPGQSLPSQSQMPPGQSPPSQQTTPPFMGPMGPQPTTTLTTPPSGEVPGEVQPTVPAAGAPGTTPAGASGTAPLGAACNLHTDCTGWGPGATDMACCNGHCTQKQKDWSGVGYCPDVCQDAPSPLGKPGTCSSGYSWPRSSGQPCDTHSACSGWVAGKADVLGCCNGTCATLLKDWTGAGYCPDVCQDAPSPLGQAGSCSSGYSWPRLEGQPCDTHAACSGWVAGKAGTLGCCNNKCTTLLKDYTGTGYCPAVCQDAPSPLGKAGTCSSGYSWPRLEGQPCDTHSACSGWVAGKAGTLGCCNGKCTTLLKDYTGTGYCPDVCQDAPSPLGKAGSCSSGNTWPRSIGQSCDTHEACSGYGGGACDVACCNGTCQRKRKDWFGVGYCPSDCVGSVGGSRGTCSPC